MWCIGGQCDVLGVVWCIGGQCGVLGASGVYWKLWNLAYNSSVTPMLSACSKGHCVVRWKECAALVHTLGSTIVIVTHAPYL